MTHAFRAVGIHVPDSREGGHHRCRGSHRLQEAEDNKGNGVVGAARQNDAAANRIAPPIRTGRRPMRSETAEDDLAEAENHHVEA